MRQQISKLLLLFSLFLPAAHTFAASAPDAPERQPPPDEEIENVIVTGQRSGVLRRLMEDFIVEIGTPSSHGRGYARWRDRLCVGVYNLPDQSAAHYIVDKLTLTALELGLKTGSPGCDPNLHIVFSPDARALAGRMVEESRSMFLPFGGTEGTTRGVVALEQFRTSDAPVRWWQITMIVDEFGLPAVQLPGSAVDLVRRGVASRLKSPLSDAIWAGLIIVDAAKLDDVKWPQLADYLAMVALAQLAPEARPAGYDSILNLFTADPPPRGMTDMDRTYLRALYEMDTMMMPHTQRGIFSHRMVRELHEMEDGK